MEWHRSRTRNHSLEESTILRKAANTGNIKQHKDWITWSRALNKYLSAIIGQYGVPLRYVIRDSASPDYTIELQPDYDFEQLSINCTPLTGLTYNTDASKLHQLINGFVQGETSDTWINPKERKQDSRLDYLALLD